MSWIVHTTKYDDYSLASGKYVRYRMCAINLCLYFDTVPAVVFFDSRSTAGGSMLAELLPSF